MLIIPVFIELKIIISVHFYRKLITYLVCCKFYFFKGSPFKWHCVEVEIWCKCYISIQIFNTKNVLSEIRMLWIWFFSVKYFSFLFETCLNKWVYFWDNISTKIAEDSDDISKKTVAVKLMQQYHLEIGKLYSGQSRILGNLSCDYKQLFRKNENLL